MNDPEGLVSALEDEIGGELRVVAEYDDEGYDLHYVRADVRPKVEEMDVSRIHQELVLQGIGKEHLEDLFDAGRLQCSVHRFEDMTAWHFVETETTGGYVGVDSDAAVDVKSLTETCREYL